MIDREGMLEDLEFFMESLRAARYWDDEVHWKRYQRLHALIRTAPDPDDLKRLVVAVEAFFGWSIRTEDGRVIRTIYPIKEDPRRMAAIHAALAPFLGDAKKEKK